MAISVLAAVTAGVSYFLDWHAVPQTPGQFDGLACAFMPDCDPSLVRYERPDRATYTGPIERDSGYSHSGVAVVLLLVALAGLAWVSGYRPRWWLSLGAAIASLGLFLVLLVALFDLSHMFDVVWVLWPERVFGAAIWLLFAIALGNVVVQPALYLSARRDLSRQALPRARVVDE